MRLHRFYIEQKIAKGGEITLTDTELIHQLANVFRFKSGQKIIVFDGTGFEYEAEIILINKKEIKLKVFANQSSAFGNSKSLALVNQVSLFLSLIKKNNFELATEKCTEIGVAEIHPIISERSEKKDLNIERLNKIVKEASEQSGRTTLPQVFPIIPLELAVSQVIKEGKVGLVFHTVTDSFNRPRRQNDHPSLEKEEKGEPLLNPLPRRGFSESPLPWEGGVGVGSDVAAFVGPEGGWTEAEMELFKQNNFQILSLGSNILRAETAAMIAIWEALRL